MPGRDRAGEDGGMAAEHVREVPVRRHVFDTDRSFSDVLDGIYGGISQPDIGALFGELAASTSYDQFSSLVERAQGSAGLMVFLRLELDGALALDPQAPDWRGRHLISANVNCAYSSAIQTLGGRYSRPWLNIMNLPSSSAARFIRRTISTGPRISSSNRACV